MTTKIHNDAPHMVEPEADKRTTPKEWAWICAVFALIALLLKLLGALGWPL